MPPSEVLTENERVDDRRGAVLGRDQPAEKHCRDDRNGIGFEEVGRHACAVADVVADVVGDDARVARIVLWNAGFDLADQVRADVGALGEDAATEPGEDRDERAAEGQANQCVYGVVHVRAHLRQHEEIAGDAEQAQADHEHAGNGAAAECDVERRIDALGGRLGGADVGAHGNVHADVPGQARENGTDREADGHCPVAKAEAQDEEQHHADDRDRRVLAVHVGLCAFLDAGSDLLHPVVTRRLPEYPLGRNYPEQHGDGAGNDREPQS